MNVFIASGLSFLRRQETRPASKTKPFYPLILNGAFATFMFFSHHQPLFFSSFSWFPAFAGMTN